jgi:Nickel responsive protein SCO4226-like
VPEYLLELYASRSDRQAVEAAVERAREAAERLTRHGTPVRYVRSIFVPEDETWFLLYDASSVDLVRTAADHAGLAFDRVAEAVTDPKGGPR